jgi:pilus assembly protein CpaE
LMDADFMFGDAAIHLDLTPPHTIVDLVPYVDSLDSVTLGQVVEKHSSGMDLLPRPSRPEQADTISPDLVRSVVSVINSLYGFVVVDTQLSYDERMLAVLDQADVFLVVLSPQLGALRNTRHFLEVAKMVGYPSDRMCFVLNHIEETAGFSLEDVISVVETRRIWQIPNEGSALAQAINLGAPLTLTAPQSPYSRAVGALADHVRVLASSTTARALE